MQDKSSRIKPFGDEVLRALANLRQHYDALIAARRSVRTLPYNMRWRTVSGRDYLYRDRDRIGNGSSLGPRGPETEAIFAEFVANRDLWRLQEAGAATKTLESCRVAVALGAPALASPAARIARELETRGLLGSHVMVVGTNALPAYEVEAAAFIGAPDATEDFDVAWTSAEPAEDGKGLWQALKAVDETYTVNTERTFQALNAEAYAIEVLIAPSKAGGFRDRDAPRPIPLEEQEWLLLGHPVEQVVVARDRSAARLVVPDPRYFALHKLWMAEQAKRNPLKRPKDRKQGIALLNAVAERMPQYPLDTAFVSGLPEALVPMFNEWATAVGWQPSSRKMPSWLMG